MAAFDPQDLGQDAFARAGAAHANPRPNGVLGAPGGPFARAGAAHANPRPNGVLGAPGGPFARAGAAHANPRPNGVLGAPGGLFRSAVKWDGVTLPEAPHYEPQASPLGPFRSARAAHGRNTPGSELSLGHGSTARSPVVIANVQPTVVAKFGALLFDVLETSGGTPRGLDALVIRVLQGTAWEVVFWFGEFLGEYATLSEVVPRPTGHHFQVQRLNGWISGPVVEAWAFGAEVP